MLGSEVVMTAASAVSNDVKVEIANEAVRIVTGARRSAYGKPEDNFARIRRLWNAHLVNIGMIGREEDGLKDRDVPALMDLMKTARLAESPDHRDSVVDKIGYTLTYAEMALAPKVIEGEVIEPVAPERKFNVGDQVNVHNDDPDDNPGRIVEVGPDYYRISWGDGDASFVVRWKDEDLYLIKDGVAIGRETST